MYSKLSFKQYSDKLWKLIVYENNLSFTSAGITWCRVTVHVTQYFVTRHWFVVTSELCMSSIVTELAETWCSGGLLHLCSGESFTIGPEQAEHNGDVCGVLWAKAICVWRNTCDTWCYVTGDDINTHVKAILCDHWQCWYLVYARFLYAAPVASYRRCCNCLQM